MNLLKGSKMHTTGLFMLLLASVLLSACQRDGTDVQPSPNVAIETPRETEQATVTSTTTPTQTEEPTPAFQFDVFRETPNVGVGQSEPLPTMSNAGPASLSEGQKVSTDQNGEALLQGVIEGQACSIFVFFNGSITKSPCPASASTGGNTSCQTGSAAYRDCDALLIQTPSMEAFQVGTWSWITYLPDEQLTVLLTSDGMTIARSVLEADGWVLSDDTMEVPAGTWLYTAPDDMLREIPGVPAREARPWDEVPALLNQYPRLIPWMERALAHAQQDDVPFPEPDNFEPTPVPGPDLTIELEVLGQAEDVPKALGGESGYLGIPVLARVSNRGDKPAGIFKVAVFGTGPEGRAFLYPFAVIGQESLYYPYTSNYLPPGEQVEFQGWVLVNAEAAPDRLLLQAAADSCAGEEFFEPFCRVDEYDEGNNVSEPVEAVVR